MRTPGNSRRSCGRRRGRPTWAWLVFGALLAGAFASEAAYLSTGSFTGASNVRTYGTAGVFDSLDNSFTDPHTSANYGMKAGWTASLNLVGPLAIPTAQEIDVQGSGLSIASGDMTPSPDDNTDFGSVNADWASAPRTFAILNSGDLPLTVASVASDNPEFAVSGAPGSVPGGGSALFIVTFNPANVGVREATLTITSDDADEGSYTFLVRGEGIATLEVGPAPGGGGGQPQLVVVGGMIQYRDETGAPIVVIDPATPTPLVVNGSGGDDTLTVDFGNGDPIPPGGLVFHGGGQGMNGDTLVITGGAGVNTATYTFYNERDGQIDYDGSVITYTGLEPVLDNMDAVNRIFTFTGGAESIQVTGVGAAQTKIDSTLGESVTFNNPTGSMTVNAGTGDDLVDVQSLSAGWGGGVAITIHGDDGDDHIVLGKTVATAAPFAVHGDAHAGGDSLFLNPEGDGSIVKNTVTITGGGIQPVNFATLESVTVNERPTAALVSAPAVTQADAGRNSYSFTVVYTDTDNGVDVSTVDTMDVAVTGPGGPVALTLAVEASAVDGSPRTATYTLTPPGGTWNDADNGTYTLSLQAGQVTDILGAVVTAGLLGSFTVTMDTTAPVVTAPLADQLNLPFQRTGFTVNSGFTDPPPAPSMLSYAIQANTDPLVAAASVNASGVVSLGSFHKLGSTIVTVRATDQGGNVADDSFTVTVIKADTSLTIASDGPDPSETDETTTVNYSFSVTAPGGAAPTAPTGMVTITDGDNSVMVPVGSGTGSTTFATSGAKVITASYPGDANFNGSMDTEAHVVNNPPVFALTTSPVVVNGAPDVYSGPNLVVESDPGIPRVFTVGDFARAISSDDLATGNETGQTVFFTLVANDNPGLFVGSPQIGTSAGPGFADSDLTFTTVPGAVGIANLTVRAEDSGFGGNGAQASATATFSVTVYGARPYPGDLLIADRGNRVFSGELLLVNTNGNVTAGMAPLPEQNILDNGLVDAYEVAIHTNSSLVPGKDILEFLVIDYETVKSAKGRGRQGLYGINSVSLGRRLITTGGNFSIPVSVEVLPHSTATGGAGIDGDFLVGDSGSSVADPGKVIRVDRDTGAQTLLSQGGELYWLTGMTVAPEGTPAEGKIYTTDIGNVFGKTAQKNDVPRKILEIDPVSGAQTLLVSEVNDFTLPIVNKPITNLYHPTGIDVNPVNGELYIADSFSRTIWKLGRDVGDGASGFNAALTAVSIDSDFIQPVHIAVDPTGRFLYVTDGETGPPEAAYAAQTRILHRVDTLDLDANGSANSSIFMIDGFFKEPRGIEILPPDPLTGN